MTDNPKYKHHPPTSQTIADKHQSIRQICSDLEDNIKMLVPIGEERDTAIIKLQEVMFWANAGIARNQNKSTIQKGPHWVRVRGTKNVCFFSEIGTEIGEEKFAAHYPDSYAKFLKEGRYDSNS